jgi:hypothetical protein
MNTKREESKLCYLVPEITVVYIREDIITASGNDDGDWGLGRLPG